MLGKVRRDPVERVLGELAEGGDLAAEDARAAAPARPAASTLEHVVARHRGRDCSALSS